MSSLPLPTELIQQILEEATSTSSSRTPYQYRQRVLRNCCLASRSFLNIARPLLYSVVSRRYRRQLDDFLDLTVDRDSGHYVKVAAFALRAAEGYNSPLGRIAKRLPFLRELSLAFISMDDLVDLQRLKELRKLTIGGIKWYSIVNFKFSALQELVITVASNPTIISILSRRHFPVLRAVGLRSNDTKWQLPKLPNLIFELETSSFDSDLALRLEASDLVRLKPTSLWVVDFEQLGSRVPALRRWEIHHVRFGKRYDADAELRLEDFLTVQNFIRLATFVETLILPASLLDISQTSPHLVNEVDIILGACTAKGIEVLYEDWGVHGLMIPKVWTEKVRRRRALEQAQA